jgi:hypothetical protein
MDIVWNHCSCLIDVKVADARSLLQTLLVFSTPTALKMGEANVLGHHKTSTKLSRLTECFDTAAVARF